MKKSTIAILLLVMLIGVVSVFATSGRQWHGNKTWKSDGFHQGFDKSSFLEKLGLSEDATDEEVKEALKVWKEGNKDSFGNHGHKSFNKQGFGHGGFGKSGFGHKGFCNKG
jgi:hypothetical protein